MQQLTEEQVLDRDELFFTILNDFIEENYDVDEDYIMEDEDLTMTAILYEHFEENFKIPTLEESALEDITGYDINEELYIDIYTALLDESVGSKIAGVRYGVQNFMANREASRAKKLYNKASASSKPLVAKYKAKYGTSNAPAVGFVQNYRKNKLDVYKNKTAQRLKLKKASDQNLKNIVKKRTELEANIGKKIQNTKNKVGGFFGTVAGHLGV